MAAIAPPALAGAVNTEVGFTHTFAQIAIQRRLEDALNVEAAGLVRLVGDAAGSGSDVIRVTNIGGIGFNLPMAALASETAAITPSPFDLGYSTVTIADYGLAFEESYKAQILGREPAAMLDALRVDERKLHLPCRWRASPAPTLQSQQMSTPTSSSELSALAGR